MTTEIVRVKDLQPGEKFFLFSVLYSVKWIKEGRLFYTNRYKGNYSLGAASQRKVEKIISE